MKTAVYVKNACLRNDPRLLLLLEALASGGVETYDVERREDLVPGTDLLLSVGGDGTFLSAAKRVCGTGIPVLGVNMGRLGFLSENAPEDVAAALLSGDCSVEDRALLQVSVDGPQAGEGFFPFALNEVAVHRTGAP